MSHLDVKLTQSAYERRVFLPLELRVDEIKTEINRRGNVKETFYCKCCTKARVLAILPATSPATVPATTTSNNNQN